MGGTPNADDRRGDERCQVHIGGIHRQHEVELANKQQFLFQTVESARDIGALRIFRGPLVELHFFGFSTAEKEDLQVVSLAEQLNDALHALQRIDFSDVGANLLSS